MSLNAKHGFALVTYKDVGQVIDLIEVLNKMFDYPPISIHHDERHSNFDVSSLEPNVSHIPQHFITGWGTIGTCKAMSSTIEHLMSRQDSPEWFHLITGHCYPIKSASSFNNFFDASDFDLYIHQSTIYPTIKPTAWELEMQKRYVRAFVRLPFLTRNFKLMYKYLSLPFLSKDVPFSPSYACRSGGTYYSGNRAAALALKQGMGDNKLIRWFSKRQIIDEALPATIFGNTDTLRIATNDLRFVRWLDPKLHPNEPNPKTLSIDDFSEIEQSDKFWARKFLPGRSDSLRQKIREVILLPRFCPDCRLPRVTARPIASSKARTLR
ncbi:MAG: hypothetical protein KF784_02230 [Fimbriimonadaceae bacterium]|nr:hypothetical protein [Fimbriimonadaceae bacterium]